MYQLTNLIIMTMIALNNSNKGTKQANIESPTIKWMHAVVNYPGVLKLISSYQITPYYHVVCIITTVTESYAVS